MRILAFSNQYQHNISSQSHRPLFSHSSTEVRGEFMPERKFASTRDRTHNHQVTSPTRSLLSHPGGAFWEGRKCWLRKLFSLQTEPARVTQSARYSTWEQAVGGSISSRSISSDDWCQSFRQDSFLHHCVPLLWAKAASGFEEYYPNNEILLIGNFRQNNNNNNNSNNNDKNNNNNFIYKSNGRPDIKPRLQRNRISCEYTRIFEIRMDSGAFCCPSSNGENSWGILKRSWRDSACFEMFKTSRIP